MSTLSRHHDSVSYLLFLHATPPCTNIYPLYKKNYVWKHLPKCSFLNKICRSDKRSRIPYSFAKSAYKSINYDS